MADGLYELQQFISARTGWRFDQSRRDNLLQALERRMDATAIADYGAYRRLLMDEGPVSQEEWRQLIGVITVGETFFFRDRGQFALLRERILPSLLAKGTEKKTLRLWSAGCSTGEEAYSLAILVDTMIGGAPGWTIDIIGTDINEEALTIARAGRYSEWALRATGPELRNGYFHMVDPGRRRRSGAIWEVAPSIRSVVSFYRLNLLDGLLPERFTPALSTDLIICRNVFIYFQTEAIRRVLTAFFRCLNPGGFLLTGHGELLALETGPEGIPFDSKVFPEGHIWQKPVSPRPAGYRSTFSAVPRPVAPQSLPPQPLLTPRFPKQRAASQPPLQPPATPASKARTPDLTDLDASMDRARDFADRREFAKAEECCRTVIAADALYPEVYYLLGLIRLEQGDCQAAHDFLQKALFLAPDHGAAQTEMNHVRLLLKENER
ncbi:hypothetical protein GTO89_13115 [Heliobacterium gestii]|uniref:protein-glutamate O-methyltransferase n=1 Tax=Heliomicrobium gestii TaxID=2699 RepID=A0A845LBC9_HELGE|nr:protein-glutamate O-methyltransferase CheR [Heliomicrobium gestii]MBM7867479.1 chemotaxis protein methyltransferase CheR [Heliomicrobium gestii]MZP43972.1 hypothetical protein [Heliomicrobium gestii]